MITSFTKHREFIPKLLAIATPMVLQNFLSSSLNFLDVFMIGQLGEKEVAAVGIGNQIYFLFLMFVFSIASATAIFTAQYWGKKDITNIRSTMGIGITLASIISVFFTIVIILFPDSFITIFNKDSMVINLGAQYIQIIAISYNITAITIVYSTVLRSTEHVTFPMVTSMIAIALNTILNFLLIFGNLGFPRLKVKGAAMATIIARGFECSILLIFSYLRKHPTAGSLKQIFNFSKVMIKKYIKIWLPVMGQSMGWALGYSMYSVIYGNMSTAAIAAYNIACSVERICLMLFTSLGHACSIMVGNRIGAGEEYKARDYAKYFLFLSLAFSIIIGIILITIRQYVVNFYNLSDKSSFYLYALLLVMGCIIVLRAKNITFNAGILKAGGDTLFSMIIDMGGIWLIGVPIAAIAAFVFKLPVYYVMALAATEELVKMIAAYCRFFSNKWVKNLTKANN